MFPCRSSTDPDPVPLPPPAATLIVTTEGSTWAATSDTSHVPPSALRTLAEPCGAGLMKAPTTPPTTPATSATSAAPATKRQVRREPPPPVLFPTVLLSASNWAQRTVRKRRRPTERARHGPNGPTA